jgi:hypothetical protein
MKATSKMNLMKQQNIDGFIFYSTKKLPSVSLNFDDVYYTVKKYDNMGSIANKFYGTPDYNWFVELANDIPFENEELVPGRIIRIPSFVSLLLYVTGVK